jgi:hypothetical protein
MNIMQPHSAAPVSRPDRTATIQAPALPSCSPVHFLTVGLFDMDQGSEFQVKHEASARVRVKSLGNQEPTSVPLLHDVTQCSAPKGWPTLPCRVERPWYATLWSLAVDITLLACSITFLVFALIVRYYNEASIAEHRTATDRLVSASKYV